MKHIVRLLLLSLGLVAGATVARATLYQVILVNVRSPQWVEVEGKRYAMKDLTAAVAKNVHGDDRIMIKLLVPGAINKAEEKQIIAMCRKAGARTFYIGFKD